VNVRNVAQQAKVASTAAALASTAEKNAVLRGMAERMCLRKHDLVQANAADMAEAREKKLSPTLVSRLLFDDKKIRSRHRSLLKIADLPDPVGQPFRAELRPNGLEMARVRVPLGVILMVYEARPHVTVNAGAFCLKSGNAAILRGGSEAKRCNELLGELWTDSLAAAGLPTEIIQVISGSHDDVAELLTLTDCIDLIIPRGGKQLIRTVAETTQIPVIKHFEGICHVYFDAGIDVDEGLRIALDSKCLMPAVCNAAETLLVHASLTDSLPRIVDGLQRHGVEVRACPRALAVRPELTPATDEDWRTEYLDMVLSVRVVDDATQAIDHINRYGSHHTDSIMTDSESNARRFLREVDSSVVLVNASTMFCDGESLGMGAEIGISTDKLHARGPMGLTELTSYKFVIRGTGHAMGEQYQATPSAGDTTDA